jgi:hypothetical protein
MLTRTENATPREQRGATTGDNFSGNIWRHP